ncbi:E3 ubiquitin-protein ligase DTX3L-like isoform X1 [Electrophorus electricus]|uniref:E3 ubiquitin-protein ligase DTX3L-like isoform X1 n=1 Tax=Electrophorus electricus TaxID=8005 RepID=UPI0015D096FE|nr:E3 ubiquitin-protein ligase DTX3L-like isoform X1 [Electrophorus electricus]XP_035376292.1 E3 ubiquitin-protein ligase DTX3L-like isoform X1 [Electrophorus electricus]
MSDDEPMDVDIYTDTHDSTTITTQPGRTEAETFNQASASGYSDKVDLLHHSVQMSQSKDSTTSQGNPQQSHAERGVPTDDVLNDPAKPSEDTANITIKVEWTKEIPPKWKMMLQKALQSWFNENVPDEKLEVVNITPKAEAPLCAEVVIKPSRALNTLKGIKKTTFTFKEIRENAPVQFLVDEMMSGDGHEMTTIGGASSGRDTGMKKDPNLAQLPGSTDTGVLTIPVSLYWYLSCAYRKEIHQIENEFGVKIDAEVSVSITAKSEKTKSDCVQNAIQRFTDLVQDNAKSLDIRPIPQAQMESDIVKEVLCNIQSEEAKLMLHRSADSCLIFAPKQVTSMLQKQMSTSDTSDASSNGTSQKTETLEMDMKDTQAPLVMNEKHWELVKMAFSAQLSDIENKYGVVFHDEPYQGSVKVSAQSTGALVNLQTHALRVLMHLYQKVTMSTVTCKLREPDYANIVIQALKGRRSAHCWIDSREKYGSRKLVGLPKHLLPAIADIEMEIGKSVFDDTEKQLLGYSEYLAQRQGQQGLGAEGGAEAKGNAKDKESVKSEEDKCPICMDTFTDKKTLKCGHDYCNDCLRQSVKNFGEICPVCKKIFGKLIGNQPEGTMDYTETTNRLPGFTDCGTIVIKYQIPPGIQTEKHPNPGQPYSGTYRTAYLPANKEGKHVLHLLQTAFHQKLTFTVGTSTTTGATNSVTWNDIHHKTSMHGGPQSYGYPDANYLKRVRAELKAKGIE